MMPATQPLSRFSIAGFAVFVAIAIVHLVAQLGDFRLLADITQSLLMPLLIVTLLVGTARPRRRLMWLIVAALFFSWLGDLLPRFVSGDAGFLTMVGCFLIAQIWYIAAFLPFQRRSVLRQPLLALPYVAAFALLVAFCFDGAGMLLVPVVIYGVALTLMAMLSNGLGIIAGVGGAVFFVSDAMIALRSFAELAPPASGFWIMLTYLLGQALIIVGVLRRVEVSAE